MAKHEMGSGKSGSTPEPKHFKTGNDLADALLDSQARLPVVASFPISGVPGSSRTGLPGEGTTQSVPDEYLRKMQTMIEQQAEVLAQNQILIQTLLTERHAAAEKEKEKETDMAVDQSGAGEPISPNTRIGPEQKPKLEASVIAHMKKTAAQYRLRMDSVRKSDDRIDKLKSVNDKLREGKLPSGVGPFKIAFKNKYLDNAYTPLNNDGNPDTKWCFNLVDGESYALAKQRVYMEYLSMQNKIDQDLALLTRDKQKAEISFDKFLADCREPLVIQRSEYDKVCDDLGTPKKPSAELAKDKLLEKFALKEYDDIISRLASNRLKEVEKREKQRDLDSKQREAAANLSPQAVAENFVGDLVDRRLGRKFAGTNVDYGSMLDLKVKAPTLVGDPTSDEVEKGRALSKSNLTELKSIKNQMRSGNYKSPVPVGGYNGPQATAKEQKKKEMAKLKQQQQQKADAKKAKDAKKGKGKGKDGSAASKPSGKSAGKGKQKGRGKGKNK